MVGNAGNIDLLLFGKRQDGERTNDHLITSVGIRGSAYMQKKKKKKISMYRAELNIDRTFKEDSVSCKEDSIV